MRRTQLLELGFDVPDITDLAGLLDGLGLGLGIGKRSGFTLEQLHKLSPVEVDEIKGFKEFVLKLNVHLKKII